MRILGEGASARKTKEEVKIMFKDLNGLDETQKAYLLAVRAKILSSNVGGSQSGNGN